MTGIFSEIDQDMTDFIRADRRKPLGYYAQANIREAQDAICLIQRDLRNLNRTNIDAAGRQLLFEMLDQTIRANQLIDDVLRSPKESDK